MQVLLDFLFQGKKEKLTLPKKEIGDIINRIDNKTLL
jgi:hypothetical protein